MYSVRAFSRLHFGLLNLPFVERPCHTRPVPGEDKVPPRHFGGVGLMVQEPQVRVAVRPAPQWSAEGPLADRAVDFARRLAVTLPSFGKCFHIKVEECPPEHMGLGTGTQLGLAVARALALSWNADMPATELARHIGRGRRSAVGIHGFDRGGFLVEGGKGPKTTIAPLLARMDFPEAWKVVLALSRTRQGAYGDRESEAFAQLQQQEQVQRTDSLCRLVLLGMLPALVEADLPAFSEALFEFNQSVGEMFRAIQGGVYSHAQTAAVVDFIRRQGIVGVGQSSWGPTVFAVADGDRAGPLAQSLKEHFGSHEVIVTSAGNRGAESSS
jgi:beta-RFAP synthase